MIIGIFAKVAAPDGASGAISVDTHGPISLSVSTRSLNGAWLDGW